VLCGRVRTRQNMTTPPIAQPLTETNLDGVRSLDFDDCFFTTRITTIYRGKTANTHTFLNYYSKTTIVVKHVSPRFSFNVARDAVSRATVHLVLLSASDGIALNDGLKIEF